MCFWYKILKPFYNPYKVPVCCVGCKKAKNNECTKRSDNNAE